MMRFQFVLLSLSASVKDSIAALKGCTSGAFFNAICINVYAEQERSYSQLQICSFYTYQIKKQLSQILRQVLI